MERLSVSNEEPYDAIEASIHVGRYALALPFAKGRRVLDIACGEGYGSWLLAQAGASHVDGVDVSREAISRAETLFKDQRIAFKLGQGESLVDLFREQAFDLIVSIETIEHVSNPTEFLKEIKKVSKRDSIIIITCPNDHWYYSADERNPFHQRKFTFSEFKETTTSVLGDDVQWLIGSASFGFNAIPEHQDVSYKAEIPQIVRASIVDKQLYVPSTTMANSENCSYFVGVWHCAEILNGAGAVHSISMDAFVSMISAEQTNPFKAQSYDIEGTERGQLIAKAISRENEILAINLEKQNTNNRLLTENYSLQIKNLQIEHDLELRKLHGERTELHKERDLLKQECARLLPAALRWFGLTSRIRRFSPTFAKFLAFILRKRLTPK